MRLTSLLFLALCTQVHAERFFGTIQIGEYHAVAAPSANGAGGFRTKDTPIYADAVVNVDEGQSITWEWMRIRPKPTVRDDYQNLNLTVKAPDKEFQGVQVDLNPSANNIWVSPPTFLEFHHLLVEGTYQSFSFTSDFSEMYRPRQNYIDDGQGQHGFHVPITLDYENYPLSLGAGVSSSWKPQRDKWAWERTLAPSSPVRIEPHLKLDYLYMTGASARTTLHHTPAGDANSDGQVNFQDFAILASGFGLPGTWDDGDFDADGLVGFSDFTALANEYQQPQAASVPEPASLGLLVAGLAILAAKGGRHGSQITHAASRRRRRRDPR